MYVKIKAKSFKNHFIFFFFCLPVMVVVVLSKIL